MLIFSWIFVEIVFFFIVFSSKWWIFRGFFVEMVMFSGFFIRNGWVSRVQRLSGPDFGASRPGGIGQKALLRDKERLL